MTQGAEKPAFADSRAARLVALLLIIAGIAVIAWHHREDILSAPQEEAAAANPQLFACISERTAQVDGMLADGVINAGQASDFRSRAIQFCQQQFPPED